MNFTQSGVFIRSSRRCCRKRKKSVGEFFSDMRLSTDLLMKGSNYTVFEKTEFRKTSKTNTFYFWGKRWWKKTVSRQKHFRKNYDISGSWLNRWLIKLRPKCRKEVQKNILMEKFWGMTFNCLGFSEKPEKLHKTFRRSLEKQENVRVSIKH